MSVINRRPGWARGLGFADLLPIAVAVAVLLFVIVMAVLDLTATGAPEDPEVPEVVVREVTTPDGVEHLCAITVEGGISCDWERPQPPPETDSASARDE